MDGCALLQDEDEDVSACLVRYAPEEARIPATSIVSRTANQALPFLRKQGQYEIARTHNLTLLDLSMPGVDGWSVLDEMHNSAYVLICPLSFSQLLGGQGQELAEKLGARRYMTKPSSLDGLVEGLRSICQHS
jgi:CheY-like chemotaxis protein